MVPKLRPRNSFSLVTTNFPLQKEAPPRSRKVLMIAYLFPPIGGIGAAGSQRVLKFTRYLPSCHWQPVILTVKEAYYESYLSLDPKLLEKIPPEATILRTSVFRWLSQVLMWQKAMRTRLTGETVTSTSSTLSSTGEQQAILRNRIQRIKDAVTDLFEIPDEEMGWIFPSLVAGLRAIRRESIDTIYATGRPWTALVVGALLRQLMRKPLVVDFRDPWMTNPFRSQYSALKNRADGWLEQYVIKRADVVIANTAELKEEFLRRFPREPSDKFVTLLNGYDPDDYISNGTKEKGADKERFTLTHTGFLYGKRDPKAFLEAVKLVVERQLVDPRKLRVRFVGSIELPYNLSAYLSAARLQEIVTLHEHVPYHRNLEFLHHADALLLLQPGTTTQVPSKLFEYVGMKKPILAISPRQGATCRLITEENLGDIADPDDIEAIVRALQALYEAWEAGVLTTRHNGGGAHKFDVRQITGFLAALLEKSTSVRH
jgi:glycosyltransferase involved in cell wall biosynthesis